MLSQGATMNKKGPDLGGITYLKDRQDHPELENTPLK